MITSVRGPVLSVGLDHAVVEVGGVGLEVRATPSTLAGLRRGEDVRLHTTLVVREDSLTLYGFAAPDARELFTLLQTVSGVGPRLAMAMLAVLEPDKLCAALSEGNITVLTQVPGIGRKGAERLIVELRDKVSALPGRTGTSELPAPAADVVRGTVVEALVGLGFSVKQAEQAVDDVLSAGDGGGSAERGDRSAVLRQALLLLGRK